MRACAALSKHGIAATHLHVSTLKPFDCREIMDFISRSKYGVVTMENHTVIGGLGTIVAERMAEAGISKKLVRSGLPDTFLQGASKSYLMNKYGINAQGLVRAVERLTGEKIDIKDDDGTGKSIFVTNVSIKRFGLFTELTLQGGLNFRSGVIANNISVTEYSGDRHGIRFDAASTTLQGVITSKLSNFVCQPSSIDTTVGVYVNLATTPFLVPAQISNGEVIGANIGIDCKQQYAQVNNVRCSICNIGFRAVQHNQFNNVFAISCTTGFNVIKNTNLFTNVYAYNNVLGASIENTSTLSSFRTGVFSGNTTNISDSGTQTAISQVSGINTSSSGSSNVPIDSTGEKTVTIAHGLSFTPDLFNVQLTVQRNTVVSDYAINPPLIYLADASNVYCKVRVITASATTGATITLNALCVAKKASRQ
jgi:hypothetical protein